MAKEIIDNLETALGETIMLLESFTQEELNKVPFEGSWTAAQVGDHLLKSETGMDGLLHAPTEPVSREPDQHAKKLEQIFMDFDTKMKSPDFIVPDEREFNKEESVEALKKVKYDLIKAAHNSNLTQLAPLPQGHPFEGYSKLEMIYFLNYHTRRHNHQIEKIRNSVQ